MSSTYNYAFAQSCKFVAPFQVAQVVTNYQNHPQTPRNPRKPPCNCGLRVQGTESPKSEKEKGKDAGDVGLMDHVRSVWLLLLSFCPVVGMHNVHLRPILTRITQVQHSPNDSHFNELPHSSAMSLSDSLQRQPSYDFNTLVKPPGVPTMTEYIPIHLQTTVVYLNCPREGCPPNQDS